MLVGFFVSCGLASDRGIEASRKPRLGCRILPARIRYHNPQGLRPFLPLLRGTFARIGDCLCLTVCFLHLRPSSLKQIGVYEWGC